MIVYRFKNYPIGKNILLRIGGHKWLNSYMFGWPILCFVWKMAEGGPAAILYTELLPLSHLRSKGFKPSMLYILLIDILLFDHLVKYLDF